MSNEEIEKRRRQAVKKSPDFVFDNREIFKFNKNKIAQFDS